MASTINASTTLGLISTADTSGVLQLQTANTTAVTVNANQTVSLAVGTANGVTYLNGSKVLTSGSALTFDGTNLGVGTAASTPLHIYSGSQEQVRLARNSASSSGYLTFYANNSSSAQVIYGGILGDVASSTAGAQSGALVFYTANSGTVGEGMRLGSSGLSIGTSTVSYGLTVQKDNGSGYIAAFRASAGNPYITLQTTGGITQIQGINSAFTDVNNIAMQISGGNVGIGTSSPAAKLHIFSANSVSSRVETSGAGSAASQFKSPSGSTFLGQDATGGYLLTDYAAPILFYTNNAERARIDSSGNLLVGTTSTTVGGGGSGVFGFRVDGASGIVQSATSGNLTAIFNRTTNDGTIVSLRQDGTEEGSISVSGTTVSYNGGHLSRYAQTTSAKDNSLVKGTVLSNLDEMNVYTKDGQPVANEQLNKVKVSDTEGDVNVAGVFVSWSHDEDHNVDEINMAMTGDMIIRIAQSVTVVRGDLLMSAGDGTAKPQGDDIVRSKTVAKVTSNHVTCTYADGSYCVPCVLMAC